MKKINRVQIEEIFRETGLHFSRMIGGSKSLYRKTHKNDDILFNANIVAERFKKLWWGDLNITLDAPVIQRVADRTGLTLYVLSEMLARFDNEDLPFRTHKKNAHAKFVPGCDHYLSRAYKDELVAIKLTRGAFYISSKPDKWEKVYYGK